jgi:hypothetical protein
MKKLLTLLLTLCLCIASVFSLTACGGHEHSAKSEWSKDATHHWHACKEEGCTEQLDKAEHSFAQGVCVCGAVDSSNSGNAKAELATAYKSVATSGWNQFGAGTVVSTQLNALPSDLPETDLEEKTGNGLKNAKADAATMFALIYMIGEYYENDNFVISNGVVSLPLVAVNMGSTPVSGTMHLLPSLDKANNNAKLEMILEIPDMGGMSVKAYYNFDINYDFANNTLIGFNLVMVQDYNMGGTETTSFQQEKMTAEGRYFWIKTPQSAEYQAIALEIRAQFHTKMETAQVLTGNFDTEFNNYVTNANAAYEGVMNS